MSNTLFSSYSPVAFAAQDVGCRRGGRLLFQPISFTLRGGDLLSLEGANGVGKTTLLRCLAGFVRPAIGTFIWNGRQYTSCAKWQGQLAYLGHTDAIKGALSIKETLEWPMRMAGISGRCGMAMAFFHLQRRAALSAGFLSAGWRRRLVLARLIAVPRPIWLLDEPMTALDERGQGLFFQLLEAHLAAGGTAIITHHGEAISSIAHERVILEAPERRARR